MLFVDNENVTDPRINLAIEEYLLRNIHPEEDILLFYINEPSIIIGRNQNTVEEINVDYIDEHQIHVVRRLSGGGAVYHDHGNLNFSFIAPNTGSNFNNFQKFTAPVIEAVNEMGVAAELSGRNDILVEGRKISGNAQYIAGARMVSHGTLLFDTDLSHVGEALRVKASKIESKGIKSIRSRVANISEFLNEPMTIEIFRQRLLAHIFSGSGSIPQYRLTKADWLAINQLSQSRYQNWDWNYGRSPDFNIQKVHRFPGGEIDARLTVEKGMITQIKFYGDFFGRIEVRELESRLINVRYRPDELNKVISVLDVSQFFSGLTSEELVKFLY
jgi:lipoate-protein ligase A